MIPTRLLITLLLLVVLAATATLLLHNNTSPEQQPETTSPTATTTTPDIPIPAKPVLPTAEMLGQHFVIGHWANTPVASTTALIEAYQLGGVIIMSAPEDPDEIKDWVGAWQAASEQPLFIAIDQEGGPVSRLKGSRFIQTSQKEITGTSSAYTVGKTRGSELAALGINLNFAPVLDSAEQTDSFMYDRVFPDRESSATLAASMLAGFEEAAVFGAVKHFPGHADTPEDSHTILPTVSIPLEELDEFTRPFRELIAEHPPIALMTAHVFLPEIDTVPATLSSFFLTDYLRDELQYTGLIITDDMIMDAITASSTSAAASVQALRAGADMILFAAEPTEVTVAIMETESAMQRDPLFTEALETSYWRIIETKQGLD